VARRFHPGLVLGQFAVEVSPHILALFPAAAALLAHHLVPHHRGQQAKEVVLIREFVLAECQPDEEAAEHGLADIIVIDEAAQTPIHQPQGRDAA
jgi:hypothetical protein